jgi:hypothetical protein
MTKNLANTAANNPATPKAVDAFMACASLFAVDEGDEVDEVDPLVPVAEVPAADELLELLELSSTMTPPPACGGSELEETFAATDLKASRVWPVLDALQSCQ